jgi:hypothetical protein
MTDLTPAELEYLGVSEEEIVEASRGHRTLHASVVNKLRDLLDRRRHRKKHDDEHGMEELGGLQWADFVNKVRGERRAREQQRRRDEQALDAMSPREYDRWRKARESRPVEVRPFAPREVIALQDARTQDLKAMNKAREERAERLGLPKAQRDWQRRDEEITKAGQAKRAQLHEDERALNEWIREQREQLGPAPTLESLEAIA